MSSVTSYRRLPGKWRTPVSTASLYVGSDHFLLIKSHRLSEEYHRFYFKDVQSIIARKTTPFHFGWAGLFVLVAISAAGVHFLYSLGVAVAGCLFLWLRGASAEVRLQTAITSERLRSLHRWKTAKRVLPELRTHIEAVQGRLAPGVDSAPGASVPAPPPFTPGPGTQALAERSSDHLFCFAFLAVEAILLGTWLATPLRGLEQAAAVAGLVEFLVLIVVLVRQNQQRIPPSLRMITYIALGRWVLMQFIQVSFSYKAVLVDRVRTSLSPLTLDRGIATQIALASLTATAIAGLYLSLRSGEFHE